MFLIRHTYVPGWHLPGGGVETGETTEEALRRELLEEGCIQIDAEPVPHGVFFNSGASKRDHVVVYVIRTFTLVSEKIPDREIAEAGFFPLTALPESTTQATRRRLAEILGRNPQRYLVGEAFAEGARRCYGEGSLGSAPGNAFGPDHATTTRLNFVFQPPPCRHASPL